MSLPRLLVAPAVALALLPVAPAHAKPHACRSADLRFPFQPGGPKDFGVFRLTIDHGTCTTAHRVAKAWKVRFQKSERSSGRLKLRGRVAGFTFTTLRPNAAQTFRLKGVRGATTLRFDYVVPNG